MATLSTKLTLTSTDLLSDALGFSVSADNTVANTTGLTRTSLTSTSKVNQIFIDDGDLATTGAALEGQFIDITDNHGLRKRYVIMDGAATSVATGTIIVADTDIGSTSTPASNLIGGTGIDVTASETQRSVLELIKTTINHANGHNGSITAAAVATAANGPQSTTLTNAVVGEGATFIVDNANSTLSILSTDAAGVTNSAADHPILVEKSKFTSPAFVYIKNTATYHASDNRVFVYYDNHGAEEIMEIRGGGFAFVPLNTQNNLRAYTSTSGTIVESMVVGTEA